jgi:iron-sulfur cluster repair protein YtfE (RIC family)
MEASDVRERVLRDHAALRTTLDQLEPLAREVLDGASGLRERLRDLGETLLDALERHMAWEDAHLAPMLRQADSWGKEREELLRRDHAEQRQVLRYVLEKIRDAERPIALIARNLLDLSAMLRSEIVHEEETLLDPSGMPDEPPGVELEAG